MPELVTIAAPFIFSYDTDQYRFAELARCILKANDLERIPGGGPLLEAGHDQDTIHHRRWYAAGDDFLPLYRRFVAEIVAPLYDEPIVFQAVPTFRVHLPDNLAVGAWHRDREYHHSADELNFWLPFTDTAGTNSLWVETGRTFTPVTVRYGQVYVFNGATAWHGNTPNLTGRSRVSIDFRVYPARLHQDRDERTVAGGVRFALGEYWDGPI